MSKRTPLLSAILLSLLVPAPAQQLSFRRAVELAVANSTTTAIASADEAKAKQTFLEARNRYVPQLVFGSGVAYSNGFPLSIEGSAPSIFNINSQAFLFNAAGRDYMKSSRTDWNAASRLAAERRQDVILEAAQVYSELDKTEATLSTLQQQESAALRVEQVVQDRYKAGIDPEVEVTRARLGVARVRMDLAQSQGRAEVLRTRLAQLTGLRAGEIRLSSESIPQLPAVTVDMDKVLATSGAVLAAREQAEARKLMAKAEHKMNYPSVDLAAQYAILARFNNYDQFFASFQRHNVTLGVVIRFPFLNKSQDARAGAADAEARRAEKQAAEVRDQVESDTLRLRKLVEQLAASRDVAKLEYQLATSDTQAMMARLESGGATVRDLEAARVQENQKYAALLDALFELDRAQMQLMRMTGDLERWALGQ
jgi:outer membrane protein